MQKTNRIGIWLDHAHAHLIDFTTDPMTTRTIESQFTQLVKAQSFIKGENAMHDKEQRQQRDYYKRLGAEILLHEEVLLFGPTDAKTELFNLLSADTHFEDIKFHVQSADKMTENQEHAFVKHYFQSI